MGMLDKTIQQKAKYPEDCVDTLGGKLFVIFGLFAAESSLRLVEALQKANKDFDMLCLPNMGATVTGYTRRRGWDYFVTHLLGKKPPHEFRLVTSEEVLLENVGGDAAAIDRVEASYQE